MTQFSTDWKKEHLNRPRRAEKRCEKFETSDLKCVFVVCSFVDESNPYGNAIPLSFALEFLCFLENGLSSPTVMYQLCVGTKISSQWLLMYNSTFQYFRQFRKMFIHSNLSFVVDSSDDNLFRIHSVHTQHTLQ